MREREREREREGEREKDREKRKTKKRQSATEWTSCSTTNKLTRTQCQTRLQGCRGTLALSPKAATELESLQAIPDPNPLSPLHKSAFCLPLNTAHFSWSEKKAEQWCLHCSTTLLTLQKQGWVWNRIFFSRKSYGKNKSRARNNSFRLANFHIYWPSGPVEKVPLL